MKRLLLGIIAVIGAYVVAYPLFLSLIGYYPWGVSWEVAEKIVAKHGTAKDCLKIIHPIAEPMSPTEGEQRSSCIYDVAKLTKDPSACELLMPSSYGWSCLGAAEKPNSRQCWFDFGPTPPQVGRGNDAVTIPACASNPKSMQENRCCELAETLYVDKENNCDALKEPTVLHDQCLELMAKRDKNLVLCDQIKDDNVRSGCEVAVRALVNDQ